MTVVERRPVPVYEVECCECGSRIRYMRAETVYSHITCPVCGISLWADAIRKVGWLNDGDPDDGKDG